MNLAMESVLTEDQARELVSGRIQDAFLLKLAIDVENRSGLVIAVVSVYRYEIIVLYSVFNDSTSIKKVRTFEDAGQFAHDFIEATKTGVVDKGLSESVGRLIYKKLDKSMISSMTQFLESGEASRFNTLVSETLVEGLKVKNVNVQVDAEKISSVKFRYKSPLDSIAPVNPPVMETGDKGEDLPREKSAMEKQMEMIEKTHPKMLQCKTVLSPVAGVEFEELRAKQKLLFQIPIDSQESKEMAKLLGAIDNEGNPKPIIGEFLHLLSGKNEYYIYAKGPGGILLRAFEEGPVRLAIPKVSQAKTVQSSQDTSSGSMNLVIGIVLTILVILLGVMFML